jgi:hypothetical protein
MEFTLDDLLGQGLEAAAQQYEEHGYFIITGVDDAVTAQFRPLLAEQLETTVAGLDDLFDPDSEPVVLPVDVRQRLSRVESTPELARGLLTSLEPVFKRLLGPIAHVSSTFHAQFKSGAVPAVDHGGYKGGYLEVQGQYLLHQDFTGAGIPTSPSALTLWVGQNSCPDWNLRLYPGSHRHGLLCNQWLSLEDPRLAFLGTPVDIQATRGNAVIFNALLLHSSSNPGPRRRVSCDIRFFPLCGFLPTDPYVLGTSPMTDLRDGLARADGATLRAPVLEDLAFLGQGSIERGVPRYSILNWANYLQTYLGGDPTTALPHMERFVNAVQGVDSAEAYTSKFHLRDVHLSGISRLRQVLGNLDATASDLEILDRHIAVLAGQRATLA